MERVELNGDSVTVIDVYADYPSYKPVEAKGEGFACVDDAARAAVLLMQFNEATGKNEHEKIISGLVNFVFRMQISDGRFYNFLQREESGKVVINKTGRTSKAEFGWWAARAVWALGEAARYYSHRNSAMYNRAVAGVERTIPQIDSLLRNYGVKSPDGNPTWLLYRDGADATSELVLGLNDMYETTGDTLYSKFAGEFCKGMLLLQRGECGDRPYGMIASNADGWHAWANSQAAAILQYSRLTGDASMVSAALREVNCFLPHWAGALFFRSCDMNGRHLDYSNQIAYDVAPAVMSAVEAYELTREHKYKTLAAILASWFFGNNTAHTPFYFQQTGICFDGTIDSVRVNKNSGAESTIEALVALVELQKIDCAYAGVTPVSSSSFVSDRYRYIIDGREVEIEMVPNGFSLWKER